MLESAACLCCRLRNYNSIERSDHPLIGPNSAGKSAFIPYDLVRNSRTAAHHLGGNRELASVISSVTQWTAKRIGSAEMPSRAYGRFNFKGLIRRTNALYGGNAVVYI